MWETAAGGRWSAILREACGCRPTAEREPCARAEIGELEREQHAATQPGSTAGPTSDRAPVQNVRGRRVTAPGAHG